MHEVTSGSALFVVSYSEETSIDSETRFDRYEARQSICLGKSRSLGIGGLNKLSSLYILGSFLQCDSINRSKFCRGSVF